MSTHYDLLTEGEQAHWDEYANLRGISDWPGFDDAQDKRRQASRDWLVAKRKDIYRSGQPKEDGDDGKGWDVSNRRERYETLKDDNLNVSRPKHEVTLPCTGAATDTEKVYIEEREVYLAFGSTTDEQKSRKIRNSDWLVARRKELYHLMENDPSGNEANSRQKRYDHLCIATHHGKAYEEWDKAHNKWGQELTPDKGPGAGGRDGIVAWCKSHLGTNENPSGSNRGSPEPSGWQKRVYGGDGVPWCACFTVCSGWDNGIKGSGTASVQMNVDLARQGQGMFRGYTTDPSRVQPGDHCAIGGTSTHTGVVVGPSAYDTIEGNTSPGSEGSQYNGGTTAKRQRKGEIVGWMLIRV